MNKYLSASWNSVVSLDLENSWAARSLQDALKHARQDARFQQKQMQEKEEKLLKLYENQQQRAFERVGRGSAGSNNSLNLSTGKVRQLFEERRQKAGIDRSYPLEPLKSSKPTARGNSLDRRNTTVRNVKTTVQKSTTTVRNGKPTTNNRQVTQSIYNNNGGEENYVEKHYIDDEADGYLKQHQDIVDMMNNHNLNDSLDNEEMPHFGFDDEPTIVFNGKLANVGGRLPSQATPIKKPPTKTIPSTRTSPPKKPAIKTTLVKSVKRETSSTGSIGSPPTSPEKTAIMSKARTVTSKSPTASRPSVKSATRPPNTAVQRDDLVGCRFCQRRFASDRLQVHEDICSRTAKKKRKIYDATKHRVEGTEVEPYTRKAVKTAPKGKTAPTKNNWRQKHEEFISTIRAAKHAQAYVAAGGNLKDLPPPPPSSNPDYVQCPHCGRRFNDTAAERHIPKCASYAFNKPRSVIKMTPKR